VPRRSRRPRHPARRGRRSASPRIIGQQADDVGLLLLARSWHTSLKGPLPSSMVRSSNFSEPSACQAALGLPPTLRNTALTRLEGIPIEMISEARRSQRNGSRQTYLHARLRFCGRGGGDRAVERQVLYALVSRAIYLYNLW
jgi:hypothetical protein